MNIGGIFAILDDVAATLDDVAVMSKVAAKKTAGILRDDLAVNANLSSNFASDRELPVLWQIAKGSLINKLIILPMAFLLSAFAPWAIAPILILGAMYLSYEGAEKVEEYLHYRKNRHKPQETSSSLNEETEQEKVKKAIRTDFILSIEIVVLALSTVKGEALMTQIIATTFVAILATIGVYGLVALLVRIDDFGLHLSLKGEKKERLWLQKLGTFLINLLPKIIKILTIVGVIAMLLVAGGIFTHNIDALHHIPWLNTLFGEILIGLIVGFIIIGLLKLKNYISPSKAHES